MWVVSESQTLLYLSAESQREWGHGCEGTVGRDRKRRHGADGGPPDLRGHHAHPPRPQSVHWPLPAGLQGRSIQRPTGRHTVS